MPFFSIIIPVYNRAELITATVNSVLDQVFDDYELIVVNDGSTDRTEEILIKIAKENPKVKYLWQKNSERGAARNYGLKSATGFYVVFLDSDDLMHPDHLTVLNKKIKEQNFPNFIATKYDLKRDGLDIGSTVLQSLNEGYYDINLPLKGSHFGCNFAVKRDNQGLCLFVEDRKYAIIEDWMFITQNLNHDRIYIVDVRTITMNDHDARSMRGDYLEINSKRVLAANWIEMNTVLNAAQKKNLWGFSYQFCAIQCYVNSRRNEAFRYILKAIRLVGIDSKMAELLVKIIIGYRQIQRMRS